MALLGAGETVADILDIHPGDCGPSNHTLCNITGLARLLENGNRDHTIRRLVALEALEVLKILISPEPVGNLEDLETGQVPARIVFDEGMSCRFRDRLPRTAQLLLPLGPFQHINQSIVEGCRELKGHPWGCLFGVH